jgi:hypothetical protein
MHIDSLDVVVCKIAAKQVDAMARYDEVLRTDLRNSVVLKLKSVCSKTSVILSKAWRKQDKR